MASRNSASTVLARHSIPSYVRTAGGHVFSVRCTDQPKTCRLCESPDHLATHCPKGKRTTVRENEKSSTHFNEQASVQQLAVGSYSDAINGHQAPPQSERQVENHGNKNRTAIVADVTVETSVGGTQVGAPADGAVIEPYPGASEVSAHGCTCTKCYTHSSPTPTAPQHPPGRGKTSHQSLDTPRSP
eukprot:scpid104018/ scgid34671/ 